MVDATLTGRAVLVTGGHGFVGQYLRHELSSRGLRVILLTRKLSSCHLVLPNESIIVGDLGSIDLDASQLREVEAIFHLAWSRTHEYLSQHHLESELDLQKSFVKKWAASGISRFLAFGSCYEYGTRLGQLRETDICLPATPYGESKLRLLNYLDQISIRAGKQYSWFRCFYLYGLGQPPGTLWNEISTWTSDRPPIVLNNPQRMRDFVPIEEAVWMATTIGMAKASTGIFNLGSGRPRTVQAQARFLASKLQIPVTFEVPDRETERSRSFESSGSWADTTRLFEQIKIAQNCETTMRSIGTK